MAKTATLSDDFSVNSAATKWPWSYGMFSISGGVATVTAQGGVPANEYSGLQTGTPGLDLTGSYIKVKMTVNSITGNAAAATILNLNHTTTGGTGIVANYSNGSMTVGRMVGYTVQSGSASFAVTAGSTIHVGIGEGVAGASHFGATGTAGNIYFFTSTNGTTWTQRHSIATPAYANNVLVLLGSDYGGQASGTNCVSVFDDLNINASSGPITASPTGIASAQAFGTPAAIVPWDLTNPGYKDVALQFVSTAENGTLDWSQGYAYIEYGAGIGDNRGYTAGIVGWTTATFDLNPLIKRYRDMAPGNVLEKWIDELDTIDAMSTQQQRHEASLTMLGQAFMDDWVDAATNDPLFRQAQREERDAVYWNPAYDAAVEDGLSPLGLLAYYDIGVNHGHWEGDTVGGGSFNGIVLTAKAETPAPAQGGNEEAYLTALFDARWAVLQDWGDAQTDGRDPALRSLVAADEWGLVPPISWSMYGTPYTINSYPVAGVTASPAGIATAQAFGVPTVTKTLTASPSGIASAQTFGNLTVNKLLVTWPAGIATAQTFGTPTLIKTLTTSPPGVASAQAFGSPTLSTALTSSPPGIPTAGAFGVPTLVKTLTASPAGIGTAQNFGSPAITGSLTTSPTGIASAQTFGTPTLTGEQLVGPAGFADAGAFGAPTATTLLTASPTGIPGAEAFGTLRAAHLTRVTPDGIDSESVPGDPAVSTTLTSSPVGIAGAEAFGAPEAAVEDLTQWLSPTGIPRAGSAFGAPHVYNDRIPRPVGIASLEAFGIPKQTNVLVTFPTNLPSRGTKFGAPAVATKVTVAPSGVTTREAFGQPTLYKVVLLVGPAGLFSHEAFGAPRVVGGSAVVPYDVSGTALGRRYSGRLSGSGSSSIKPNRWEGTYG